MSGRVVECTIPVLPVADLVRSLRFYTEQLGFQVDWGGEPGAAVASVSRDGRPIMLRQTADKPGGAWVWIGLEDDGLFDELRRCGVTVVQEPRNYSWAYEMKFADPDGNVLWLGTEAKVDRPPVDGSRFDRPPAER